MTTNFGPDATALPDIPSAQTPKEGVVKEPALLKGLTNIFDAATNVAKSKQKNVVSEFTKKQLLLAEGYAQGKYKSREYVQTLFRQNLISYMDANPGIDPNDFIKAQAGITGLTGGAKIVADGTEAEQRFNKEVDDAIGAGILNTDATVDEQKAAVNTIRVTKAAAAEIEIRMKTLELQAKDMSLSEAVRKRAEEDLSKAAFNQAVNLVPLQTTQMQNMFDNILKSNDSEVDKINAMNDLFINFQNDAATKLIHLKSDDRNALLVPFKNMFDVYLERASGGLTDAQAVRKIDRIKREQEMVLRLDPISGNALRMSELYGQGYLMDTIGATADVRVIEHLAKIMSGVESGEGTNPYTTDPAERKALHDMALSAAAGALSNDEALRTESVKVLKQTLSDVEDFENKLKKNKKAGQEIVSIMASQTFFKALQANPELNDNVDAARAALENQYSTNVWELMADQFLENQIINPSGYPEGTAEQDKKPFAYNKAYGTPTPESVGYRSISSGMEFFALDPTNTLAVSKARELNKKLKPIINVTLQAQAHLEGNQDYKGVWERVAPELLGKAGTGNQEGDLTADDFKEDRAVPLNRVMKPLTDSLDGASDMVKPDAVKRMSETLSGPYKKMVELFGSEVTINDAIAKKGTTREKDTKGSRHFHGDALDLSIKGMSDEQKQALVKAAKEAGFTGFGFGENILHVDRGAKRGWSYQNKLFGGVPVSDMIGGISQ